MTARDFHEQPLEGAVDLSDGNLPVADRDLPINERVCTLLARAGASEALEDFLEQNPLGERKTENQLLCEARIWEMFGEMSEQAEGGLYAPEFQSVLGDPDVQEFLAETASNEVAREFASLLVAGTNASMEEYAQITSYDFLEIEAVRTLFSRHEADSVLAESLSELVCVAPRMLFSAYIRDEDSFTHFAEIVAEWTPKISVEIGVESFLWHCFGADQPFSEIWEHARSRAFIEDVFSRFSASQRAEVDRMSHIIEARDAEGVQVLREAGLVTVESLGESKTAYAANTEKALATLLSKRLDKGSLSRFQDLSGDDGPLALARQIGEWLKDGNVRAVSIVLKHAEGFLDEDSLSEEISSAITSLLAEGNHWALVQCLHREFPIDRLRSETPEAEVFARAFSAKFPGLATARGARAADLPTQTPDQDVPRVKPSRGSRKFVPLGVEELREKVERALGERQSREIVNLSTKVRKDLSKVEFDAEQVYLSNAPNGAKDLSGYQQLENGLTFLGCAAGGDWETPVFFLIYFDGKELRAYIPQGGNPWNTDTKKAYGNDGDSDYVNAAKRAEEFGFTIDEETSLEPSDFRCIPERVLADIQGRFQPR